MIQRQMRAHGTFKYLRTFSNWSPGATWTPPKEFYAVNLPRELANLQDATVRQHQHALEGHFHDDLITYFEHSAKKPYPRKRGRKSTSVAHAIAIMLEHDSSPVAKMRSKRLTAEFKEPPIEFYNAFLQRVYERNPDPKKIATAYRFLPAPRPQYMDPQILDDLLQILISLRHSKDPQGHLFRSIIDDMDSCKMLVTPRERALYLLFLSSCDPQDVQQVGTARAKISEKMISWHSSLCVDDHPTLNTLLEVGLRLDLSILEDFVQNQVLKPNSETYRRLLKARKISPETVVKLGTMSPTLLLNVLDAQLRSENPEAAEDFLAHILSEYKHTFTEPLSPRDAVVLQQLNRSFDLISQLTKQPVMVPLVPSMGLFQLFLTNFTRTQNFHKIQRTLVQMASHGCYPPTYAIYKILENFNNGRWGVEELDKLIYYICDVSLYHEIMTVPLATSIAKTYRQFNSDAANELKEFLIGLVGSKRKQVPVRKITLIPEPKNRYKSAKKQAQA